MVQLSTPVCRYQKHVVCVTIYLMFGFLFQTQNTAHTNCSNHEIGVTTTSVPSAQQLLLWPEPNLSNKSFPLG